MMYIASMCQKLFGYTYIYKTSRCISTSIWYDYVKRIIGIHFIQYLLTVFLVVNICIQWIYIVFIRPIWIKNIILLWSSKTAQISDTLTPIFIKRKYINFNYLSKRGDTLDCICHVWNIWLKTYILLWCMSRLVFYSI